VPARCARGGQRAAERLGPALDVGREAAGDDQPTPPRARSAKKAAMALEVLAPVFEPGVHAAHQHAVLQRGEAEVE
jgi:hypothetical protein